MKRIVLFLVTNIAVLLVLSVVLRLFGLDRAAYDATGLQYGQLLA
ncbi:MAG: zinc metalloprotease HtpX, partial [Burkholderiales bacterium]|nr:zinc metalloprotease HtpX [Burkholderiales bacterium]